MPVKPSAKPSALARERRSPSARHASIAAIQNGEQATITAASPLGTVSSAQTTPPFPSPIIKNPSSVMPRQVAGGGAGSRRSSR